MKFLNSVPLLLGASLVHARPSSKSYHETSGAVYFLDSDPEGASIVSLPITEDGLGEPERIPTGGLGLIGNDANGPVASDPLFSQNSVIVRGNRLLTVNPGSNTLSVFHIPKDDPAHPMLLGEPVDTVGDVPTTVAYSEKNKLACVANTGSKPGVQCFSISSCGHPEPVGALKPLPIVNQTSPITGPPNTVSDILFNPSETALFVSVKGDGANDGYVLAYRVEGGRVSDEAVESRPSNVAVAFGMSFVSDDAAVLTSPAFGAAVLSVDEDLSVAVEAPVQVQGQSATCWSAFNPDTGNVYLLDAGVADVSTLDPETSEVVRVLPGFEDGMGNFDGVVGGGKLWVLQREPAIAVFDLANPEEAEEPEVVDLSGLGDRAPWIGIATYIP